MPYDASAIARDVIPRIAVRTRNAAQQLGWDLGAQQSMPTVQIDSPLRHAIDHLVAIANGDIDRREATKAQLAMARTALQQVLELLWLPAGGGEPAIPQSFWNDNSIGSVCLAARLWIQNDELLNYTEAGKIIFYNDAGQIDQRALVARVRHLVDQGKLGGYRDPRTHNPRHAQRVLKSEAIRQRDTPLGPPPPSPEIAALRDDIRRRLLSGKESSVAVGKAYDRSQAWVAAQARAAGLEFLPELGHNKGRWVTRTEYEQLQAQDSK